MTGADRTFGAGPLEEIAAGSPLGDSTHPLGNWTTNKTATVDHLLRFRTHFPSPLRLRDLTPHRMES
jgi:hypothetical protein